jgi:hypothetical protein
MNRKRPFEVGTTVKWCDNGSDCAGIVAEVHTGGSRVAEIDLEPTYLIRCPDLSEVSKTHNEVVLV